MGPLPRFVIGLLSVAVLQLKNGAARDRAGVLVALYWGSVMRAKRYRAYQEQQLAKIAVAAGASFGWVDSENASKDAENREFRHRIATFYMPMLFLMPFISSVAYYLTA